MEVERQHLRSRDCSDKAAKTIISGWKLVQGFRAHILSEWWRPDLKQYGGWAVVTGSTDGIGKSYAEELARRGFDIVLISRTLVKLQKVAEGIEHKFGRKTKIIQADFTGGSEIYQPIEEGLKDMDIGILVNNVGMKYSDQACKYLNIPDISKMLTNIINCNVTSVLQMTRIVLPNMVKRKKGLIINVASEAGSRPFPTMNVYSATKGFVDFFSRSLHVEYMSDGITVQSVMPLVVSTNMTQKIKTNILVKTADDFASEALNTVGVTTRTNGCLSHSLQSYVLHLLLSDFIISSRLIRAIAQKMLSYFEKLVPKKEQ
ncbi:very-long-chain 3-oxoacyl-CoA reductase-B-like [Rhinophrynus dorsalis]